MTAINWNGLGEGREEQIATEGSEKLLQPKPLTWGSLKLGGGLEQAS